MGKMRGGRLAAWVVAGAAVSQAQVARVDLYTPSAIVRVGEEIRLAVAARTALEQIVLDAPLTFTSSQPAILAVDGRGIVRALRPGQANITVRSGNQQNIVEILAAPKRIVVDPPVRDIFVGERIQFSATAYDANDNPIPNVAFTWAVTGANGNQINAAAIVANSGLLTSNGASEVTVRANLNFSARADRFPPQWIGTGRVNIRPRADYRVARLLSTEDVRGNYTMRRVLSNVAGNDRGQLVFRASLDGISTCVVLYDQGKFRCVANAGEPRPLGGNIVTPFGQAAINNRGEILVGASGIGLLQIDKDGHQTYPIQDGAYFGDFVMAGGFTVSKKALNDYGEIAFAFNYRRTADNITLRGLARLNQGEPEFVWSSDQPLTGLTGTVTIEDWGIDRDGVVYFQAAGSAGRGIFRAARFEAPRRLIGLTETNEGSAVTGLSGLQVAEDGSIAFLINRQNGVISIGRMRAGSAAIESIRTTGNPSNPLAIASTGSILFRGDTGAGYGLYRWEGAQATLVLPRRNTPSGEAVTAFNAGTISASGEVYAQAATATREFVLFGARDSAPLLLQTNGEIAVSGRIHLPVGAALVPGEKAANARLRLGDVRSAYEIDGGKLLPKLVDWDMLPDNTRFFGDGGSFEEPNGDMMFVVNNAIFRQKPAGIEIVLRNQLTSDDNQRLAFSSGIRPAINPAGAMALVAVTATGERRIYLRTPAGQLEPMGAVNVSRVAGGDVITAVRSLAIDNLGRVMAQLDVRNTPSSLYLWTGRDWAAVAVPAQTMVAGQPIRDLVRGPLAGGNKFYLIVNLGEAGQTSLPVIMEFGTDRWTPILTVGDALPQGGSIASFGVFDANDRGEVAVAINGNTGGSTGLMLRTADGNLRLVQQIVRPTSVDAEYVISFSEVDLRADGRVYFGSMTIKDAYTIFVAEPAR